MQRLVYILLALLLFQTCYGQPKKDSLTVYFIPGMGTDGRTFHKIELKGCQLKTVELVSPDESWSLGEYAKELTRQIDTTQQFILVGVSMGGMLASEMSLILKPEKTILISSAKYRSELSLLAKIPKYIPLYNFIGDSVLQWVVKREGTFNDINLQEDRQLYQDMLLGTGANHLKWQIKAISRWNRKEYSSEIIHIHGDSDKILPLRKVKPTYIIAGGTHKMIINRSNEVSNLIQQIIRNEAYP